MHWPKVWKNFVLMVITGVIISIIALYIDQALFLQPLWLRAVINGVIFLLFLSWMRLYFVDVMNQPKEVLNTRKVNWVLTLIMSIIFGGLGVDRFIMGHIGLGLLKLLTLGGLGIWWLIDLILIATKYKFKHIEWIEN
ncbi:MAG: NINE protein [Nanoarchaeota archaeon]|nr:NINE protein [Nanoarchaeota archaeon]